ncbi:hypothetical protein Purlil1_4367 [Purpureocillium lilacinum]|uniref:Uncharacterized protein n=1 Tax=Purpureocillium lilacinum TaxID=33203 RepID=A0ABR0C6J7_PURLI|nr:hypothetical protein Purlil1_4367 [Purpureocillium lilacinum]
MYAPEGIVTISIANGTWIIPLRSEAIGQERETLRAAEPEGRNRVAPVGHLVDKPRQATKKVAGPSGSQVDTGSGGCWPTGADPKYSWWVVDATGASNGWISWLASPSHSRDTATSEAASNHQENGAGASQGSRAHNSQVAAQAEGADAHVVGGTPSLLPISSMPKGKRRAGSLRVCWPMAARGASSPRALRIGGCSENAPGAAGLERARKAPGSPEGVGEGWAAGGGGARGGGPAKPVQQVPGTPRVNVALQAWQGLPSAFVSLWAGAHRDSVPTCRLPALALPSHSPEPPHVTPRAGISTRRASIALMVFA